MVKRKFGELRAAALPPDIQRLPPPAAVPAARRCRTLDMFDAMLAQ